jgi:GAF domain-containing protein
MALTLYKQIAKFGRRLGYFSNIEKALTAISDEAKQLLQAERCSIFLVDHRSNILWTKLSNEMSRIAIGLHSGIVGLTYETEEAQVVNDPYNHPKFLDTIDKQSGYVTKNLITMPIFGSDQNVIGVIQLLNKIDNDQGFTTEDKQILTFLANYVSGTLELALKLE